MVITATSRWATWDSSCDSTASISGSSSRRMSPLVTHSTAAFWLRPVANALGMSESAIATFGLGMSASAQRRSTMPCNTGAPCGDTSWGRTELLGGGGAAQLAADAAQLRLDHDVGGGPVQLGLEPVAGLREVVEGAGSHQLVQRAGAGLHLRDLVLGPLHGQADVAHLLADAGDRLVDACLRLGGGVGGLDRLLAGTEGLDLDLEPLRGVDQLGLLGLELVVLDLQVAELARDRRAPCQRLPGQVVAVLADGLARLVLQLGGRLLEGLRLELHALARGGDVRHAPAHLLEQLELPLVGVVQRLSWILVPVECLRCLRLEDHREPLHQTHRPRSSPISAPFPFRFFMFVPIWRRPRRSQGYSAALLSRIRRLARHG